MASRAHRLDRARRPTGRGADADVVERDHAPIRSERVDERRVPVVEVTAEVLQQDERHITFPELAVRVVDRVPGRHPPSRRLGVPAQRVDLTHGFLLSSCLAASDSGSRRESRALMPNPLDTPMKLEAAPR